MPRTRPLTEASGEVPPLTDAAIEGKIDRLAGLSWVIYTAVGIKKHGFAGYMHLQCVPAGIKGPILLLLVPLVEEAFFRGYAPAKSLLHGDLWSGNAGAVGASPVVFDPAAYVGDREADEVG